MKTKNVLNLSNTQNAYKSLIKHSTVGQLILHLDGKIIISNQAFLDLLSLTLSEIQLKTFWNSDFQTNRTESLQNFQTLLDSDKQCVDFEKEYAHKAGHTIWVNESVHKVYSPNQKLECILVMAVDITTAKCKYKKLKESESYLMRATEHTSAIITILDLDGTVKYVNHVVEGININEYVGSSVYKWLPKELSNSVKTNISEIKEHKQTIQFESKFEDPTRQIHYHFHDMSPIFTNSKVSGVTFVSSDISTLKNLEENLDRSKSLVELGMEAAEMGVWEWDSKEDKLIWDETVHQLLGTDSKTFVSTFQNFLSLIEESDRKIIASQNKQAFESKEIYEGHFRIIKKIDGQLRWIGYKSKFTSSDNEERTRLLGVVWDSTKERERELNRIKSKTLEKQNIELKQFAYLASHDLKSPLLTISSYSSLLLDKHQNMLDAKANTFLVIINKAAERMQTQIKDLLDYSLIGQNKKDVSINCIQLMKEVRDNLSYSIKESNCTFDIAALPIIQGYKTELSLLFQNIISNAIKYGSESIAPHIIIRCQKENKFWKFEIQDNGIGIEEQYLSRIFLLFERLHFQDEYEGTGIGLAHCKKIVELHGGEIWATSKPLKGTSFHFTLRA